MAIQRLSPVLLRAAGAVLTPIGGDGSSDPNSPGFRYRMAVPGGNLKLLNTDA
ncbi:hypothetical protein SynPROS71_01807 [Synechococcus sp. PROS-7-1]|nr:hypothetical protein SynPROS71_01807 [Synechococcus sp. PROS-7-1]